MIPITMTWIVNVDDDFMLLLAIESKILDIRHQYKIVQVIISKCNTQALIISESTQTEGE